MVEACFVCHGTGDNLIAMPCLCKGSVGRVHSACFDRLLSSRQDGMCPTCHAKLADVEIVVSQPQVAEGRSKALVYTCILFLVIIAVTIGAAVFA